jgi:ATP-dependent Lon protease
VNRSSSGTRLARQHPANKKTEPGKQNAEDHSHAQITNDAAIRPVLRAQDGLGISKTLFRARMEAMKLPEEVGVITLPNVTLFPQALLPLYIFEPRYRRMLQDALGSHRMFAVAMNRRASERESPSPVAGIGLIRVSVEHKDRTSHLILQGITRVKLENVVRYKPYRTYCIRPLETPPAQGVTEDALLTRMRELLLARIESGEPFPAPFLPQSNSAHLPPGSIKQVFEFLNSISDPEQAADMVSCAVLSSASDRQEILEAPDIQTRLRRLIQFLIRDIRRANRKKS